MRVRPATADDVDFLWECLAIAAHETRVESARAEPLVARYLDGWPRMADLGVVAEMDSAPIGAAWARQFQRQDDPFVYVDEGTPELAIGVLSEHRGRGVGAALVRALIEAARADGRRGLCLSVRLDNPALRLYERLGFARIPATEIPNRAGTRSIGMVLRF